jgi:D-amino peptidase
MTMRKLYISADIEGVCGIADWKETEIGEAQGAYFREEMTREVAAACEAAVEAGVDEIFVKDAHGSGRSIDPSKLPENVRLMRAWTRDPYSMMAGIDGSYCGAMFIGYHSAAGTKGSPLAHTMNGDNVYVLINGETASEFHINAYTAASFGVPPLLLSGDRLLCESAKSLNADIRTVAVSEGLGNASISINPRLAARRIKEGAADALRADPEALRLELPDRFEILIRFKQHHLAYRGSFYPGARRPGDFEVAYSAKEWMDALRFMFFVL